MGRIFIHYFSGLGSCAKVAHSLAQMFKGVTVVVHSVEDCKIKDDLSKAINIFVFPVYFATVPQIMQEYLRQLPRQNNTPAAVICCYGSTPAKSGWEGAALFAAGKLLKRRGFKLFFSQPLTTPQNFTQFVPALKEEAVETVYRKTQEILVEYAHQIEKQEQNIKKTNLFIKLISPFTALYNVLFRRFLGKIYYADNACISCRLCEKNCPSHAIEIKKYKPSWNWNCQGCQRCMNICPVNSVNPSLVKLAAYTVLWFIPYAYFLSKLCKSLCQAALVHIGCVVVVLFIVNALFNLLNENKAFSTLFSLTYTKKFRRFKLNNLNLDNNQ